MSDFERLKTMLRRAARDGTASPEPVAYETGSDGVARMLEGFDNLNKLTFFPKKYNAVRGLMIFLLRNFYRLKHTYFAPKPNPEGAHFDI